MNCVRVKARMNVESDRLSNLPDDLIHKIFSFIDIKDAINTSVLSSRWRFVWTLLPYLNFSSEDFSGHDTFCSFVTCVLSHRKRHIQVYSLNLKLSFHEIFSNGLLKILLDYAFSRNVQQLSVSCLFEKKIKFPLRLFSSESLKLLRLTRSVSSTKYYVFKSGSVELNWNLPALTTLHLDHVNFVGDSMLLFSKCPNLKNLTLRHFRVKNIYPFSICHPQISSLTLENGESTFQFQYPDVVTPQLENLCIKNCYGRYRVSAPHLASLFFRGYQPLEFSAEALCSLEKVHFCVYNPKSYGVGAHELDVLLQRLHSVRCLTLNLEIVELISSSMEQASFKPPPMANLKRLNIYPSYVSANMQKGEKVSISNEVKKYFFNSSPSATLLLISHETLRAYSNAKSAQTLMAKLWTMLEEAKDSENNMTCIDQRANSHKPKPHNQENAQAENQWAQPVEKMQTHIWGMMGQMKSCSEDLGVQIDQGRAKISKIISTLRNIEVLLTTTLPASKKDKLLACFSGLCAETNTVVKRIIDGMKSEYDKKHSHVIDCFHELTTRLDCNLP